MSQKLINHAYLLIKNKKMIQDIFLLSSAFLSFSLAFTAFLYEPMSDRADHRLSLQSISLRSHYACFMILPSVVSPSFSRTFAFISRHPRDCYYPSLFPRQSHLENAVSEKLSSFSNFHFLILVTVWLLSLRASPCVFEPVPRKWFSANDRREP